MLFKLNKFRKTLLTGDELIYHFLITV